MVLAKGARSRRTPSSGRDLRSEQKRADGTPFFKGYRPQFYFRTTDVTGVANCLRHGDGDAGDNVS
jgi:elongation factor Tu